MKVPPGSRLTRAALLATLTALTLGASPAAGAPVQSAEAKSTEGVPTVHLDQLAFPPAVEGRDALLRYLKTVLHREARLVEWGGGRDNRIEYRFEVRELTIQVVDGVLRVHCSATGKLPGGQTTKSELSFGGAPTQRAAVVRNVLGIVARGVITRLAELERARRGLR